MNISDYGISVKITTHSAGEDLPIINYSKKQFTYQQVVWHNGAIN
jgi:hypothetical protein